MSEFEPFGLAPIEQQPDLEYLQGFFEELEAASYIESIRAPSSGPLDIIATARNIEIPVVFKADLFGHAAIYGLEGDAPLEIHVNDGDYEKALSFAHEVGHYLLFLTDNHREYGPAIEEVFCDYFGRQLSMPDVSELTMDSLDGERLLDLCKEYQVGAHSLIIWLMEQDILPEQIIIDARHPVSPNSDLSQKVSRHIPCLACEYGTCKHGTDEIEHFEDPESFLPVLDLTSSEFGRSLGAGHAQLVHPGDAGFKALQEKYRKG